MKRQDVRVMRAHVALLLRRHRISRKPAASGKESADIDTRTVHLAPIVGVIAYITALHEIAHIIVPRARYSDKLTGRKYRRSVLEAEEHAWQWAISHSKVRIPYWVLTRIALDLNHYAGWTGTRHPQEIA